MIKISEPGLGVVPGGGYVPAAGLTIGGLERIPKWLDVIPMIAQWLWLGLRYGSVTLPSAANPGITSGGMVGEGKLEYFRSMGALARAATADYVAIIKCPQLDVADMLSDMQDAGLDFPVVAKPDIGWCGYGVRLIRNAVGLAGYLADYPDGETFLLQRYLPESGEAGLFYIRAPDEPSGRLIGILLRDYPAVVGNGRDDVAALLRADPRLQRVAGSSRHEYNFDPARVPAAGETVRLSTVASARVGGCYRDATALATPALVDRVDAIARDMGIFLVGRFDVRFDTLDSLRQGEFTIMEVNGAGSEAVHAWDPKYSIAEGYRIVFAKQRLLFRVADANRRLGAAPIGVRRLAQLYFRQRRLTSLYSPSN